MLNPPGLFLFILKICLASSLKNDVFLKCTVMLRQVEVASLQKKNCEVRKVVKTHEFESKDYIFSSSPKRFSFIAQGYNYFSWTNLFSFWVCSTWSIIDTSGSFTLYFQMHIPNTVYYYKKKLKLNHLILLYKFI